jgi:hypothetical protein
VHKLAARIRKTHQDDVRKRIKVSNLLTRVQKYANGDLSDEDISPNRLNAIKLLLNKALPDLSSIQITGDPDNPIEISHRHGMDTAAIELINKIRGT